LGTRAEKSGFANLTLKKRPKIREKPHAFLTRRHLGTRNMAGELDGDGEMFTKFKSGNQNGRDIIGEVGVG
jgi:hypothetical protein